LKKLKGVVLLK